MFSFRVGENESVVLSYETMMKNGIVLYTDGICEGECVALVVRRGEQLVFMSHVYRSKADEGNVREYLKKVLITMRSPGEDKARVKLFAVGKGRLLEDIIREYDHLKRDGELPEGVIWGGEETNCVGDCSVSAYDEEFTMEWQRRHRYENIVGTWKRPDLLDPLSAEIRASDYGFSKAKSGDMDLEIIDVESAWLSTPVLRRAVSSLVHEAFSESSSANERYVLEQLQQIDERIKHLAGEKRIDLSSIVITESTRLKLLKLIENKIKYGGETADREIGDIIRENILGSAQQQPTTFSSSSSSSSPSSSMATVATPGASQISTPRWVVGHDLESKIIKDIQRLPGGSEISEDIIREAIVYYRDRRMNIDHWATVSEEARGLMAGQILRRAKEVMQAQAEGGEKLDV